ncbi:MAG: glycosyltransferase family 39 protein, partial [Janthinobacterium lividum]
MTVASQTEHASWRSSLPALFAVLLLTASIILLWGHFKPLDQDEIFVLQTDSVRSIAELVQVQRHFPISLDPLFYHLLGHASVSVLGATAFAIRLPSLLGYLLMQVCISAVAGRLAGRHAAVIAALVPALTATLFYAVEARPYGLLLGLSALLLLAWQRSVRNVSQPRTGALLTLAAALALALNTHYFAVLLLMPLYAAELYRTAERSRAVRRLNIDWPVVVAVAVGSAGIVFALPFQKAAGEFRKHYYNAGGVGLHAVTQSYRALFVNYTNYSIAVQHLLGAVLVALSLLLLCALWRHFREHDRALPAERVFLVVLAAMPFFGFLLARFVTHSIEVRYVLPAMVSIAVLIAIALAPLYRSRRVYGAIVAVLLVAVAAAGSTRVHEESVKRNAFLASLSPNQPLPGAPDTRIYVQNLGYFDEVTPYLPKGLRSRMVLLYSRDEELHWLNHDTGALTATHMQHFTTVPTMRYEDLRQQPGEHLVLLHPDGWEWLGRALQADGASITPLAAALRGDLGAV